MFFYTFSENSIRMKVVYKYAYYFLVDYPVAYAGQEFADFGNLFVC